MSRSLSSTLVLMLASSLAATAFADPIVLSVGHRVGDRYLLSRTTDTETAAASRGAARSSFGEDVALTYEADVEVLEVDTRGRAIHERHGNVQLRYDRADGSGSLFPNGAHFEVRRDPTGQARIFVRGQRLDPKVEAVITPLLASPVDYTIGEALFGSGQTVPIGDLITLPEAAARQLMQAHGLRVVRFDGAPSATVRRSDEDPHRIVVDYRIPVDWCEPLEMPKNVRTSRSSALLEGRITLPVSTESGPREHASTLAMKMRGIVDKHGVAASSPWRLERVASSAQRTRPVLRAIAPMAEVAAETSPPGPARIAD